MAELTTTPAVSSWSSIETQATCCEPSDRGACCGTAAAGDSDVFADPDMDEATRADMAQWTGCIAGALTEDEFRSALTAVGLVHIEIRPTHRVHEHAGSAIVRARKPGA